MCEALTLTSTGTCRIPPIPPTFDTTTPPPSASGRLYISARLTPTAHRPFTETRLVIVLENYGKGARPVQGVNLYSWFIPVAALSGAG